MRKSLQWLKGQFRISGKKVLLIVLVGATIYVAVTIGTALYLVSTYGREANIENFTSALNPLSKRHIRHLKEAFSKAWHHGGYKDQNSLADDPMLAFYIAKQKAEMIAFRNNDNDFSQNFFAEPEDAPESIRVPESCAHDPKIIDFINFKNKNYKAYSCYISGERSDKSKYFNYNDNESLNECQMNDCSFQNGFYKKYKDLKKERPIFPSSGWVRSSFLIMFYENNELKDIALSCDDFYSKIDSVSAKGAAYMLRACESDDLDFRNFQPKPEQIYAVKKHNGWLLKYYVLNNHHDPVAYREISIDKKGRSKYLKKIGNPHNWVTDMID